MAFSDLTALIFLALHAGIPGHLTRHFWTSQPRTSVWQDASEELIVGLALNAILGSLCHGAGLAIRGYAVAWAICCLLAWGHQIWRSTEKSLRVSGYASPSHRDWRFLKLPASLALVSTLLLGAWGFWSGGILRPMCDAWIHIGRIHICRVESSLVPTNATNSGFLYFQYSLATDITGSSIFSFWSLSPLLLLPVFFWISYGLYRRVFRHAGLSYLAATLTILAFEGIHLDPLRELMYPRYVSWMMYLVATGLVLRFVRLGHARDNVGAALLVLGMGSIHTGELPLYLISLASVVPGLVILANWRALRRTLGVVAVHSCAAIVALKFLAVAGSANLLAQVGSVAAINGAGLFPSLLYLTETVGIADPRGEFGQVMGPAGFLTVLLAIGCLRSMRTSAQAWLIGVCLVPSVIAFVPGVPALFLVLYRVPEVFHRVALLYPVGGILAWVIYKIIRNRRWGASRLIGILVFALIVLALVPGSILRSLGPLDHDAETRDLDRVAPLVRALSWLDLQKGPGSTFLSDPLVSFYGTSLTRHRPLSLGISRSLWIPLNVFSSPAYIVLGAFTGDADEIAKTLETNAVKFIILAPIPALDYEHCMTSDQLPYLSPNAASFLELNPEVFQKIREEGWARIYRVNRSALSGHEFRQPDIDQPPTGFQDLHPMATSDQAVEEWNRDGEWIEVKPIALGEGAKLTAYLLPKNRVLRCGSFQWIAVRLESTDSITVPAWVEVRLISATFGKGRAHSRFGNLYRFLWEAFHRQVVRIKGRALFGEYGLIDSARGPAVIKVVLPIPAHALIDDYSIDFRVRHAREREPRMLEIADSSGWVRLQGATLRVENVSAR